MRCEHEDCYKVWHRQSTFGCFRKVAFGSTHCLHDEKRHRWIVVTRREPKKKIDMDYFRVMKTRENRDYDGVGFSSRDAFSTLAHGIGNEIWRGEACNDHNRDGQFDCGMLVMRMRRRGLQSLVTHTLVKALEDVRWDGGKIGEAVKRALLFDTHAMDAMTKVRDAAEHESALHSMDSPKGKVALFALRAGRVFGDNGPAQDIETVAEAMLAAKAASPKLVTFVNRNAYRVMIGESKTQTLGGALRALEMVRVRFG